MKSFSLIMLVYITVFQSGSANSRTDLFGKCLVENGFKKDDTSIILSMALPNYTDMIKDKPKEKIACVFACIFYKNRTENKENLQQIITDIVSSDDRYSDEKRKEMMGTIDKCKNLASGCNCKFLDCVGITEAPFIDIALTMRDVPVSVMNCFVENGLKASDVHHLDNINNIEDVPNILKKIDEDKLACTLACIFKNKQETSPEKDTIQNRFATMISWAEKITLEQKKDMLQTIDRCTIEAAGDRCKLVTCMKVLRPPFLNLYSYSSKHIKTA